MTLFARALNDLGRFHVALSLEQAQLAKMDHVCRKARLKPGDTVVEAGCGWGALARHMARHYGVKVKRTSQPTAYTK